MTGRRTSPAVQGPKDIPSSVAQGAAAAARVISRINKGEIELEPIRATVDAHKCSGCRICNDFVRLTRLCGMKTRWSRKSITRCVRVAAPVLLRPAGAISGTGFQQ